MHSFHTAFCALLIVTCTAQGTSSDVARLCIFSDINDEDGYTDKILITSSFLRAVIFEDTPIIVTPPLIHSVKIRAQRFEKALENVRAGKPVILDEKTKEAWQSYSKNIESDYEKAIAAINTMDAHGKEALTKGDTACLFYEKLIQQNIPNIGYFIKEQSLADAFAYMSDLSFSRFELFSKGLEYIIAIPKTYCEERRKLLTARINAEGITIPEALKDSCAVGINLTRAQKISQLPLELTSTWKQYATKTIRELFTFTEENKHIDLSQFLRMDLFIHGHGSPAATKPKIGFIAGLPDFVAYELIKVLAQGRFVRSMIVQSCYSGGENSKRILEQLKNIPGGDSFLLVVSAIADTLTFGVKTFPIVFSIAPECFFVENSALQIPIDTSSFGKFFNALSEWYSPRIQYEPSFTTELSKLLTVFAALRKQKQLRHTNITFKFGKKPLELKELLRRITSPEPTEVQFALPYSMYRILIEGPDGLWQKIINGNEPLEFVFKSLEKKLETFAPAQLYAPPISSYSLTQALEILNGELPRASTAYAFRFPHTNQWFTDQTMSEIFTISNATVRRALMGGGDALKRSYKYSIDYDPKTEFVSVERKTKIDQRSGPYEFGIITIAAKTSLLLLQTDRLPVTLKFEKNIPHIHTTGDVTSVVIDSVEIPAGKLKEFFYYISTASLYRLGSNHRFFIKKISDGLNHYLDVLVELSSTGSVTITYTDPESKNFFSSGILHQITDSDEEIAFESLKKSTIYTQWVKFLSSLVPRLFPQGALSPQELADTLSAQYMHKRMSNELTLLGESLLTLEENIRRSQ